MDQLPHEAVVYLGDTARQPYGPKPIGEVREYALECLDHLVDQGVKALVIACNSASAAMLRDARERYDVPVVEVILPATRRAVAATRSGRIGVICTRATAESLAYDDAFAAAPHVDADDPGLPAVRRVRRAGRHRRTRAAGRGPRVPRPAGRGRRRHPDPRLHPLPAAHRRDLDGDGRRGHPGQQRGGVRQGRLPDAGPARHRARARPTPPVHRFLTTGQPEEFATTGRRFLGPELDRVTQFAGGAGVGRMIAACTTHPLRLTVIGCSGSYPGPESSASCYLLEAEHDGRTWRVLLDLGNGALGSLQRYADATAIDARLPLPPARRPLPRPVRLLRDAQVPPGRRAAEDPGLGTGRHGPPDGQGLRPRRGPRDERGVRLHPLRHRRRRVSARSRSPPARWCTR